MSDSSQLKKHRIVFEIVAEGAEPWNALLNNVENVRKAFGAEATEITVVGHGKGLGLLLKTSEVASRVEVIGGQGGVTFAACQNTMRRKEVEPADLLPAATIVDSGIAEVVRKQEAGWSYLKSGI